VYFEKSYYLAPSSADAVRPYVLLHRALADAGRVGIGRFVLRTRPHLVAIRPTRGVLGLETLYFGDEVRDPAAVVPGLEAVEVSERELDLADRLVETLETDWDPAAYSDTYREELLRILSEKEPSHATAVTPEMSVDAGSAVEDLMRALRESVDAAKERGRAGSADGAKRAHRPASGERRRA
jgi:DNA end-binding protein Ku